MLLKLNPVNYTGIDIPIHYFKYIIEQQRQLLDQQDQHSKKKTVMAQIIEKVIKQFLTIKVSFSLFSLDLMLLVLANQKSKDELLIYFREIMKSEDEKWNKIKVSIFFLVMKLRNARVLDKSFDEIILTQFDFIKKRFLVRSFQPFLS